MSSNQKKVVRDFIYVDQERLYSFYSQLNQGVAQQIFQSFVHGESATESQANPEFDDEVTALQRSKASQRTESTILYDYMYEQLETQLASAITDVSSLKLSEDYSTEELRAYLDALRGSLIFKVSGRPEIQDYDSMDSFIRKSNVIMEAFALLAMGSKENVDALNELEERARAEKDRNKKAIINEEIKKRKNPKRYAGEHNLLADEDFIKSFTTVTETFYGDSFEIVINSNVLPYSSFRGIINKQWLRISPQILRSLYSGIIETPWTMVGQITSMPNAAIDNLDAFNLGLDEEALSRSNSLRDPMRYLINRFRAMEAMLNRSGLRFEPVVLPLAIYRDIEIPVT